MSTDKAEGLTQRSILLGTRLITSEFKLNKECMPKHERELSARHRFDTSEDVLVLGYNDSGLGEDVFLLRFFVSYDTALINKAKPPVEVATLHLEIGIEYLFKTKPTEQDVAAIGNSAAWMAWPYIREAASDTFRRAGFDSVPVPYLVKTESGLAMSGVLGGNTPITKAAKVAEQPTNKQAAKETKRSPKSQGKKEPSKQEKGK